MASRLLCAVLCVSAALIVSAIELEATTFKKNVLAGQQKNLRVQQSKVSAAAENGQTLTPDLEVGRFAVLGNWGDNGSPDQLAVAQSMDTYCGRFPACEAVLTVGSNFMPAGLNSTNDTQWQTSFEHVYTGGNLQVPWHPVLGDEDHKFNNWRWQVASAGLAYEGDNRWQFPNRYYYTEFDYRSFGVRLIFLDTTPLLKSYLDPELHTEYDTLSLQAFNGAAELQWLAETLRDSTAKWNLVFGHHHILSASQEGENHDLAQLLLPILTEYNATAYFSGHEANLQYLSKEVPVNSDRNGTIHQFISGSGGIPLDATFSYNSNLKFSAVKDGFIGLRVSDKELRVDFVDGRSGDILESVHFNA
eukprot:GILK01000268.1.p1 GENE.GILK01000268.1~~GILK01000268.1.p1  ORF type:complete len:374 (+),score=77.59 GILK01000268.1:40-1122(+)